jgi:hypothetical protein
VLARYAGYLWYEVPVVFGQAANILVTFAFFAVALLLWIPVRASSRARGGLALFLGLMAVAWVAHLVLYRYHGDSFNYTALLYLPILVMVWWKPPSAREAWTAVSAFAWTASLVLVVTRVLEAVGSLDIKQQMQGVIAFDEERYFLPFNEALGIDGRWPGPFGHNGDTAMMGALLVVIAFAHWRRSSWVFLTVGVGTLLLTDGRASIGAMVAGLVVIASLTTSGPFARIPRWVRITAGSVVLVAGAIFMALRPAGVTGRDSIWPAFLDLWASSPWIGVGGIGIATEGGIAQQFGHGHSLYIDELARWGLVGFLTQFTAIAVGLIIAARAAGRGVPGPIAVMLAFLITGITEPRNSWIEPSMTGFLLILMTLTASGILDRGSVDAGRASAGDLDSQRARGVVSTTGPDLGIR